MPSAKAQNGATPKETKPKRRRYRATDSDFVAPDGGWGWLIIFACGFSNLSTFPMFQQFGLVFREKFQLLGISNAQTTTVINLNSAFNSCVGAHLAIPKPVLSIFLTLLTLLRLLNGPLFRTFSYRQVALFGSSLVATSLFLTTFCESFWTYLIFYAMCYGSGIGITQSSNSVALNTYFKKKRRIATGWSWATTGLGPVVWPYIITFLMGQYGTEGTLRMFAAFAGHAFMCSILLQPVHWHTNFRDEEVATPQEGEMVNDQTKPLLRVNSKPENYNSGKHTPKKTSRSLFSSQYLYTEDDRFSNGYEIIGPGTPMMAFANDGLYSQKSSLAGSRISLASHVGAKPTSKVTSGQNSLTVSTRPSYNNLSEARDRDRGSRRETKKRLIVNPSLAIEEHAEEDCPSEKAPHDLKEEEKHMLVLKEKDIADIPNEKDVLKSAAKILAEYKEEMKKEEKKAEEQRKEKQALDKTKQEDDNKNIIEPPKTPTPSVTIPEIKLDGVSIGKDGDKKYTLLQKIVMFFDLDLLKDPIYVNLMLGIAIANFAEINFSILTPFVLQEFKFDPYQTATFMSVLGALDIIIRLLGPFFADLLGWENKTFFLIGVLMMAGGRIILVHTQTYYVSIVVAVIIGVGKGLRTIFIALVIPSYVPLDRLPGASGLQLTTSGILFLLLGPVVGWIRDAADNYVITLHILNICTYMTAIAWTVEPFITRYYKHKSGRGGGKITSKGELKA